MYPGSLVQSVDASQGQIGKLCTDTNTFIIDPALGEFEFEDDDNELSLTVTNMIGEWGIFIPTSAVKANNTASEEGEDELDVTGVFDKAIEVSGGNKKTDILFTKNVRCSYISCLAQNPLLTRIRRLGCWRS